MGRRDLNVHGLWLQLMVFRVLHDTHRNGESGKIDISMHIIIYLYMYMHKGCNISTLKQQKKHGQAYACRGCLAKHGNSDKSKGLTKPHSQMKPR